MKLKKSTYALLALSVGIAACNTDYEDFADQTPQQNPVAASFNKAFSASTENTGSLSKAYQSFDWQKFVTGDEISVFSGNANNKFINTGNAIFEGNADDAATYYALFPYTEGATIDGNVISVNIPAVQSYDTTTINGQFNRYNNSVLSVGVTTEQEKAFALKNAGAEIMFLFSDTLAVEKVEITATQNIVGDVKITIGDDGTPTIEGGDSKTVTINNPFVGNYDNFVSVIPVGTVDLEVKYYRDGKVSGTRTYNNVNLKRNTIANLDYINYRKVTFNAGVEGVTFDTLTVLEGNGFSTPSIGDVTNGTLHFAGWKTPDGKLHAANTWISAHFYEDTELTAEWVDGFVLNYADGSIDPVIFQPGDEITLAAAPELHGYKFLGWSVNGELKQPGDVITSDTSLTVYTSTEAINYRLTIDADGGVFAEGNSRIDTSFNATDGLELQSWNNETYQYQIILYKNWWSENAVLSSTYYPTRDGYDFGYYYTTDENQSVWQVYGYGYNFSYSDLTIHTKWYKKYALDYYTENGDTLNVGNNYFTENHTSFYVSSYYHEDGKILKGWKDQDGNIYKNGQQVSVSILEELKDLKFTPILESDENASSHEGWTSQPF